MPRTATIKAPDGRTATLTIPDGATEEQIQAAVGRLKVRMQESPPQEGAPPPQEAAPVAQEPQSGTEVPPPAEVQPQKPAVEPPKDIWDYAKQGIDSWARPLVKTGTVIGDVGATMVSGVAADILGGWGGLWNLATGGDVDTATRVINNASRDLTQGIKTEEGRKALETIAPVVEKVGQWADDAAYAAGSENPLAGAAIKTGLAALAELTPAKFASKGVRGMKRAEARAKINKVKDRAAALGLNLTPEYLLDNIVDVVQKRVPVRGGSMDEIRDVVTRAKQAEKQVVDDLYRNARANNAWVPTRGLPGLANRIESSLAGYDLAGMASVQRRLDDLRNIETRIPSSPRGMPQGQRLDYVLVGEVDNITKRINSRMTDLANNPKKKSEFSALGKVKRQLENYMDHQFNTGMIHAAGGDADAVKRLWDAAKAEHRSWAKRFNEDKVISQLTNANATPEELRRWIIGASAMGAKPQASRVIKRIREISGNDSDLMRSLKLDYLHDVVAPLMKDVPNVKGFLNNWDTMIAKNGKVVEALGIDKGLFNELHKAARAYVKMPAPIRITMDFNRMLSVGLFGHGIAKRALLVRAIKGALDKVTFKDKVAQRYVLHEMAEIDDPKALRTFRADEHLAGMATASWVLGDKAEDVE